MEKELRLSAHNRDRLLPPDAAARVRRLRWRLALVTARILMHVWDILRWPRTPRDVLGIRLPSGELVWLGYCSGSISRGTLAATFSWWDPLRLDAGLIVRDTTCRRDSGRLKHREREPSMDHPAL